MHPILLDDETAPIWWKDETATIWCLGPRLHSRQVHAEVPSCMGAQCHFIGCPNLASARHLLDHKCLETAVHMRARLHSASLYLDVSPGMRPQINRVAGVHHPARGYVHYKALPDALILIASLHFRSLHVEVLACKGTEQIDNVSCEDRCGVTDFRARRHWGPVFCIGHSGGRRWRRHRRWRRRICWSDCADTLILVISTTLQHKCWSSDESNNNKGRPDAIASVHSATCHGGR